MSSLDVTVEHLRDLIAFPTVSRDGNLEIIAYLEAALAKLGAKTLVWRNDAGDKANLFATLGPEIDGGIVLSGHTDVVPVDDQDWSSDPFTLVERNERLYGRGSCDMKGFVAATLAAAHDYAAADLQRPVHFAFTHDEETGCLGARDMMPKIDALPFRPSVCIVGEPTEMRVIDGHKGCYEYTVRFKGLEGHGSLPALGVNAVEHAVRYVARLMEIREDLKARAPADLRFDPPWTTLQVGRLSGGVAHNVIPGEAELRWEMRPVQDGDADFVKDEISAYAEKVLLPAMRAVFPDADIETEIVGEVVGLAPAPSSEAQEIVAKLTGANGSDVVSFGTEAGLFDQLGISTVVCGPGSIEQAHKADEYVSRDQLATALHMLKGLTATLSRPPAVAVGSGKGSP
ncbi:MAG: acetylornithine deacetylase [Pseudomonadota bacterium]